MYNKTVLTKTALTVALSIFSVVFCFGSSQRVIQIDQGAKLLVAPEACSYQWYHNGMLMEGENNQSLSVNKGGNYEVESVDEQGQSTEANITVAINATGDIIKIILIGDSTVAPAAPGWPVMGWGHVLHYFFNSVNVQVMNFAIGGTSTKSFYNRSDGWKAAQQEIAKGDYVFIQFGHNDQKDATLPAYGAYQDYLRKYVNEITAKGGYPVLVTSVNRNLWNGTTLNTGSLGDYPAAVRQVGTQLKVPVVDLHAKSATLFTQLGKDYLTRYVFNNWLPGEIPAYPNGNTDQTHFQEMGAIEVSRLVVEEVKGLSSYAQMKALASYLVPVYEVKVSANPKGGAYMITRNASFPRGITVTVKTTPKVPNTFYNWNNEAGKSVSKSLIYSFQMEAKATSYVAVYQNAALDVNEKKVRQECTLYPNPFAHDFHFGIAGSFRYTLYTMEGVEIEHGEAENEINLGRQLNHGIYVLKISTAQGNAAFKLMKTE